MRAGIRLGGINEQARNNKWVKINLTKDSSEIDSISIGQKVIIIIGENLNSDKIKNLFN